MTTKKKKETTYFFWTIIFIMYITIFAKPFFYDANIIILKNGFWKNVRWHNGIRLTYFAEDFWVNMRTWLFFVHWICWILFEEWRFCCRMMMMIDELFQNEGVLWFWSNCELFHNNAHFIQFTESSLLKSLEIAVNSHWENIYQSSNSLLVFFKKKERTVYLWH